MTVEPPHRRTARLQDDLLQDLRDAAPAPASSQAPAAAAPPPPPPPSAAAMEVRVTPGTWARPTARLSPDRTSIVLGLGPVRIRFGLDGV